MKHILCYTALLLLLFTDFAFSFSIISRAAWKARAARGSTRMASPVGRVFVHHTVTPACNSQAACSQRIRSIQNYHIDTQKWGDVGYSFLIGGDGRVYEGRGWGKVGAHTINYNSKSYGVSFIGNFETQQPSATMLKALKDLIAYGVAKKYISGSYKINGHRDVHATACPGKNLYAKVKALPQFDRRLGK